MPPLSKPLPELRRELIALLVDALPEALKALRDLLPEGAEKQRLALELLGRFNTLNKDKIRGEIDHKEYELRLARLASAAMDVVNALEESDFAPPAPGPSKAASGREGSVLYQVPHCMPLRKPSLCRVRVAIEQEAIADDMVLDANVQIRPRVEVSDFMRAELLDMEGDVFDIFGLNEKEQNIRQTGYTQWLFRVTPKMPGEHQLVVKVSLLEFDQNSGRYFPRDISILETVTIVTESDAPAEEAPLRHTGERLSLGPDTSARSSAPEAPARSAPKPQPAREINPPVSRSASEQIRRRGGVLSALLLLIFVLGSTVSWALTPAYITDYWVASLKDTPEAYAAYIREHGDTQSANPRVEKAYYFKAKRSQKLTDMREYQQAVGASGTHYDDVVQQIRSLELKAVESIAGTPDISRLRQYLSDFPDATRLPQVKAAMETAAPADQRSTALDLIETAYVTSMKAEPGTEKLRQYLHDYPTLNRLPELAAAAPQAVAAAQPEVDAAIVQKIKAADTAPEVRTALQLLEQYGSSSAVQPVISALAEKPASLRRTVEGQLEQAVEVAEKRAPAVSSTAPQGTGVPAGQEQTSDIAASSVAPQETETPVNTTVAAQETAPPPTDQLTAIIAGIERSMVRIPAGAFRMGSAETDEDAEKDEKPAHEVTLSAYSMGSTEVTNEQYAAFLNEKGNQQEGGATWIDLNDHHLSEECRIQSTDGKTFTVEKGYEKHPVIYVSWYGATAFCNWLSEKTQKNYRLPTEAEWEYAARGGTKWTDGLKYAGSNTIGDVAWYNGNSGNKTHAVAAKKPNQSGLYDMSGNVWEWCSDRYGDYPADAVRNPSGADKGSDRVRRGGSWGNDPQSCRAANRVYDAPGDRSYGIGFRLSRTP